jgi:ribosomal protein S17E
MKHLNDLSSLFVFDAEFQRDLKLVLRYMDVETKSVTNVANFMEQRVRER